MNNNLVQMFLALTVFMLACLSTNESRAQTLQFDDAIYTVPSHWLNGACRHDYANLLNNVRGQKLKKLRVHRSVERPDSDAQLRDWASKVITASFASREQSAIRTPLPDREIEINGATIRISFRISGQEFRIACVRIAESAKKGARANMVAFQSRHSYSEKLETVLENALSNTVLPFLKSMKFQSEGAQPLLGKPEQGQLSGVFYQPNSHIYYPLNNNGSPGNVVIFSKSGRFFVGLPRTTNANDLDFELAIKRMPNRSGNYKMDNNTVSFEFATGSKFNQSITISNEGGKNQRGYVQATVPSDGSSLTGTFEDAEHDMFSPVGHIRGGGARTRSLTFTDTSEFEATEFFGYQFENGGESGELVSKFVPTKIKSKAAGSFAIKDGVLHMRESDGTKTNLSIVKVDDDFFFIGSRPFKRK